MRKSATTLAQGEKKNLSTSGSLHDLYVHERISDLQIFFLFFQSTVGHQQNEIEIIKN